MLGPAYPRPSSAAAPARVQPPQQCVPPILLRAHTDSLSLERSLGTLCVDLTHSILHRRRREWSKPAVGRLLPRAGGHRAVATKCVVQPCGGGCRVVRYGTSQPLIRQKRGAQPRRETRTTLSFTTSCMYSQSGEVRKRLLGRSVWYSKAPSEVPPTGLLWCYRPPPPKDKAPRGQPVPRRHLVGRAEVSDTCRLSRRAHVAGGFQQ